MRSAIIKETSEDEQEKSNNNINKHYLHPKFKSTFFRKNLLKSQNRVRYNETKQNNLYFNRKDIEPLQNKAC